MRRRFFLLSAVPVPAFAAPGLQVVASFTILADMAKRIGGGAASVTSLVPADTDAHAFHPGPAASRALASAAVLIENGLGFEGWMARLAAAAGFSGARVTASTGVIPRLGDPHAWQDPRNGVIYARTIAEGLAAADPANAAAFRASAAAYIADIERTDAWIADRFVSVPVSARRIVATHDAFGYYGARYGIAFIAAQGLSAEAEPSAKAIAGLVRQIRREKVRAVFLENMTDPRLARMLARETGAVVLGPLYSDALSAPDGPAPDYLAMLRHNTSLFERALLP